MLLVWNVVPIGKDGIYYKIQVRTLLCYVNDQQYKVEELAHRD